MLAEKNTRRHPEAAPPETAEPGIELVYTEEACGYGELAETCPHREAACAQPGQASKFIKGLIFALPLSISLWAGMILGLRAIF